MAGTSQGGFKIGDRVRIDGCTSVTIHYNQLLGTVCTLPGHGVGVELDRGPYHRSYTGVNPHTGEPGEIEVPEVKIFQFNEVKLLDP